MALSAGESAGMLIAALTLDVAFGDPPNRVHPVAWLGTGISRLLPGAPAGEPARQLAFGAVLALGLPFVVFCAVSRALAVASRLPALELVLGCLLLKSSFALRALGDAGVQLERALAVSLPAARARLSWLCSRKPDELSEPELVAATIESLAENCSDSFVAPIFYYVLLGVPGAAAYRAINTLDAMIGYHGRYEYLGKVAARLDDLVNLVPARLTALCLLVAGALLGRDLRGGLRIFARDRARTESPNAGRPMAAMAGLLRVELEKRGAYRLGDPLEPLARDKIRAARRVLNGAALLCTVIALGALHAR